MGLLEREDELELLVAAADGAAACSGCVVFVGGEARPGHISLPNGYGTSFGAEGPVTGVPPNELTSSERRDWLAGTPWHKHVPARLRRAIPPA